MVYIVKASLKVVCITGYMGKSEDYSVTLKSWFSTFIMCVWGDELGSSGLVTCAFLQ